MKKYCGPFLMGLTISLSSGCLWRPHEGFIGLRPSDEAINSAVNQALMNNKYVAGEPIQVETHNAVVSLSGYVKTIRQNDLANALASEIVGVKSVENHIIVRK